MGGSDREVTLTREPIQLNAEEHAVCHPSGAADEAADSVGYLRIPAFRSTTVAPGAGRSGWRLCVQVCVGPSGQFGWVLPCWVRGGKAAPATAERRGQHRGR